MGKLRLEQPNRAFLPSTSLIHTAAGPGERGDGVKAGDPGTSPHKQNMWPRL